MFSLQQLLFCFVSFCFIAHESNVCRICFLYSLSLLILCCRSYYVLVIIYLNTNKLCYCKCLLSYAVLVVSVLKAFRSSNFWSHLWLYLV